MAQHNSTPYEIYQEIFSYISDDDKATLSACSQISPWFRKSMQERMLRCVNLEYSEKCVTDFTNYGRKSIVWADDSSGSSKSERLLSALESSQELAKYIKELKITIKTHDHNPGHHAVYETTTANVLLPYLFSLTTLSVLSTSSSPYETYSKPLQSIIRQLFEKNTNLTNVNLSGIYGFSIAEVQHLPSNVNSLTLSTISNLRPLLPGENASSPGDKDGLTFTPISLYIKDTAHVGDFISALRCGVQVRDQYTYNIIHEYKRRAPYLSFAMLESLEISNIKTLVVANLRALLSFVDPQKLQNLRFQTPLSVYTIYSISFQDSQPFNFMFGYDSGLSESPKLDLAGFSRLKSLEVSGAMMFTQGIVNSFSTGIGSSFSTMTTNIPWISQVIDRLPHPDHSLMSAVENTQGPSLRSIRVVFEVTLTVMNDMNQALDAFSLFDFSPLINSIKSIQRRYQHLHDVVGSLDFQVKVQGHDDHIPIFQRDKFVEALSENHTLQNGAGHNEVLVRVLTLDT
ncbi:hypothetical protein CVT24_001820 [Panaeolus cyanescens]|uniref:F-box domain-containing protein n=1 Tax=Panaeolus cyanescens TaxID=181874 RepID=A0A409YFG1_9AGAR|nr:hypothetical protein CVT24_001820 [Panaeolus cyanescens]